MSRNLHPTHTLIVRRTRTGFDVDFAQAPDADRVRAMFGTTRIPAPFTPAASLERVLLTVVAGNPDATVVFEI